MKLTYDQLSTIIYDVVYDEACDDEIENVEELLEYLEKNQESYIEVINCD